MLGREKYLLGKKWRRSWELNLSCNLVKNKSIILEHQKHSTKYGTKNFFSLIFDCFLIKFENNPK